MPAPTLYLVDVFNLLFQVFHAIPPMTGPRGQPTNAVFGFTRDLLNLIEQKPTHLICAFDSSGPGFRTGLYEAYKANRTEMPEDLRPQIQMVKDVVDGFRIPRIEHAGWEADDIIATLARRAERDGMDVRIVTGDKDARQLLSDRIQIYNTRKNELFDAAQLREVWGIRPDQVVDFQSLVGDSVDNVPGIPLVGPKKAQALLEQLGTLDEILAHPEQAPGKKLRENLVEFADQARISRELVRLKDDLPLVLDWSEAEISPYDRERLHELFQEYGFRRLTEQMQPGEEDAPQARNERDWHTVDTAEKFRQFQAELRNQKKICVDLETTSLVSRSAEIVGWAVSWEVGR
ncbi:MAG TPA: 5'-3' exonuclease H3TH domain-containing protein, partial [Planctomycetaceae bacterium]|nr:5'-3' exonuclease H3TH domain-containing protein [Planctomycetaceae bacterium]